MADNISISDQVKGSGHFKNLKGKVIDTKETGFGVKFALVKPDSGGDPEWANTIYLTEVRTEGRMKRASENQSESKAQKAVS